MPHHTLHLSIHLTSLQLHELDRLACKAGLERGEYMGAAIHRLLNPHLHRIKIHFHKGHHHMATPGPITLVTAGQTVTATVVGFDQFGNVFTGAIPTPTFRSSDTSGSIANFHPATGLVTAVANGVSNITATVSITDASGNPVTLTDTETVTVAIPDVPPPTPVLSSIKVAFA